MFLTQRRKDAKKAPYDAAALCALAMELVIVVIFSSGTLMVTLIDREFTVNVPRERAWDYLARLDLWPTWAPHIKDIATRPPGELGPNSSGVIHLANGMKSTFHMTEFNPYDNWKWVGPFLWLTIHYDHRFECASSNQTGLRFVLDASGFGVGLFGRLFAVIYRRNLEKAIPLLIQAMELAYPRSVNAGK